MKPLIIYIGNFSFPKENAAGLRVLNNGYLFRDLGYEVAYLGQSRQDAVHRNISQKNEFDGFTYYSFSYPKSLSDWVKYKPILNETKKLVTELRPAIVVMYGSLSNSLMALEMTLWCKSVGIKIIHDCVDWLPSLSGSMLFKLGKYLDTELQKRYVVASGDGVIAVSEYLNRYYKNKKCRTVVIPPLSGVEVGARRKLVDGSPISLMYAGIPFNLTSEKISRVDFKDRLDIVIELLAELPFSDYVLNIYGISYEDYLRAVPEHETHLCVLKSKVVFHGFVDNDRVCAGLLESDYFLLIRSVSKMTQAGFPSKLSEAMGYGVPVIVTDTSDISRYIKNGENGWILSPVENRKKQLIELADILNRGRTYSYRLSQQCVNDNPFDLARYKNSMQCFLSDIGVNFKGAKL